MGAKITSDRVVARTSYILDSQGRKRSVVLDLETYRQLLEELEIKEDTKALEESVRTAKREDFVNYREARESLKKRGLL